MACGGNHRARQFFKQHGWDELGSDKIEGKYTSRAAQMYRALLEKEASKYDGSTGPMSPNAAAAAAATSAAGAASAGGF